MEKKLYDSYIKILKTELVPALGCTEPIALAYAAAKAREVLGTFPEKVEAVCSGNIIKNVKGVKVPNSGGLKGVETAVVLGLVGGDAQKELEVLQGVTEEDRKETRRLLKEGICRCSLKEGVANLFIEIRACTQQESVEVRVENMHTNITRITKNGDIIYENPHTYRETTADKSALNIRDIVAFARCVDLEDVRDILERQIQYNYEISEEGLHGCWGAGIGRLAAQMGGQTVEMRAIARAAAGSDARMGGCSLPVIINSGSGNQGMTCSLPVVEYARSTGKSEEQLLRALCISNLAAQDQKKYIGALSAYCGVVCAAAGAGAAITYLWGGDEEQIENTVVNTIANIGGMICDGAKESCAAKIFSALQAAFLGHQMAIQGIRFKGGDGIVMDKAEDTVKAMGYVGRAGMKQTDIEVLNLMIGKTAVEEIDL